MHAIVQSHSNAKFLIEIQTRGLCSGLLTRGLLTVCLAVVMLLSLAQPATAAFVGEYALGNFTFTNNAVADGSVMTPDGGLTVILTGSDTGTGLEVEGTTDLTILAPAAGVFSFAYQYFSMDLPGFDRGGYLLGSTFFTLATDDGQSGSVQVPVLAGQLFGFRVATFDNQGGPGVLAISEFSGPAGGSTNPVPEPGTLGLLAIGGIALLSRRYSRKNDCHVGGSGSK